MWGSFPPLPNSPRPTLVITTISGPSPVLLKIAAGCSEAGWHLLIIGDRKTPEAFSLPGADFISLAVQQELDFAITRDLPINHYTRKNIGYLLAARSGGPIVETDDDNIPLEGFFAPRERRRQARVVQKRGWINAYRYFTDDVIWPRGLALDHVTAEMPEATSKAFVDAPIQQGLADGDPDVDAIFRLTKPGDFRFRHDPPLWLGPESWCPFNSQNTTWWPSVLPLMYLPSHCSFRATDIWRSMIGQRVLWADDVGILFHHPTMEQQRNPHDLMADFAAEVECYLKAKPIAELLSALSLTKGDLAGNLHRCYSALVRGGILPQAEMPLVEAWLTDCEKLPVEKAC